MISDQFYTSYRACSVIWKNQVTLINSGTQLKKIQKLSKFFEMSVLMLRKWRWHNLCSNILISQEKVEIRRNVSFDRIFSALLLKRKRRRDYKKSHSSLRKKKQNKETLKRRLFWWILKHNVGDNRMITAWNSYDEDFALSMLFRDPLRQQ